MFIFLWTREKSSCFFLFLVLVFILWGGRGACLANIKKEKKKMETMEEKTKKSVCLGCYIKKEYTRLHTEKRHLEYTIKALKAKNEMYFQHIRNLQNTLIALGVNSKGFL